MKKLLLIGIIIAALAVLVAGCSSKSISGNTVDTQNKQDSNQPAATVLEKTAENGIIKIPFSDVSTTLKKYSYDSNGVTIRFLAIQGSDGKPRIAFDACDVCGGKGYTRIGDEVQCNNCAKSFKIDSLGTENKGFGCWPAHLDYELSDDQIIIKEQDIIDGKKRF